MKQKFKMGLIMAVALAANCAVATNYYVSALGNDGNSGTNTSAPWLTISNVNRRSFLPGDMVSFRGGDTFAGTLTPQTGGVSGRPLVFTSYGTGRAVINGGDAGGCGVGVSYVSVTNLNFAGSGRTNGNKAQGIYISAPNVLVDHVEVHGFEHSGVEAFASNVTITHVCAHDNGNAGIYVDGSRYQTGLYIGYCQADNNPGDPTVTNNNSGSGIIIGNQMGALVEYCEASTNGWDMPWNGNGPAGIWGYACYQTTFQYCIAHDNQTPSSYDGDGFDLDGGTASSTIQYCLSYNNQGAGFLGYEYSGQTPWTNNTYRYCISVNDGSKTLNAAMALGSAGGTTFASARVYNNTFYNSRSGDEALEILSSCPGSLFCNNIFVANHAVFNTSGSGMKYQGNCYWQLGGGFSLDGYGSLGAWAAGKGQETVSNILVGINANPQLVNPTAVITLTNAAQLATLAAFRLNTNSPCVNAGLNLRPLYDINPGPNDFWGTPIPPGGPFDMGACELNLNGGPGLNPPAVPNIFNVTANSGRVSLAWSAVPTATNYNVKRSTTSGAETNLATTSSASYADTNIVNGVTYYYLVTAVNAYGTSGNSGEVTASPPPPPPAGTVLVDFDSGAAVDITISPDANGLYWNNIVAAQTGGGAVQLNGSLQPVALVNTTNANLGWTLAVTNLSGWNANSVDWVGDGGPWQDYGGPYPAAVASFPPTALCDGMIIGGAGISVTLSGLNPTITYNLLTYGANGNNYGMNGTPQTNTLTVGTSPSPASVRFYSLTNSTAMVEWTKVTPGAGGRIVFIIAAPDGGALNFLEVTQNTPAPLGRIAAGATSRNLLTLNWTANANVHLQSATSLAPPVVWSDVPNTTGQGSATVTTTHTHMFFRLIQP